MQPLFKKNNRCRLETKQWNHQWKLLSLMCRNCDKTCLSVSATVNWELEPITEETKKQTNKKKSVHVLDVSVTLTAGCKQRCFLANSLFTKSLHVFTYGQLPARWSVGRASCMLWAAARRGWTILNSCWSRQSNLGRRGRDTFKIKALEVRTGRKEGMIFPVCWISPGGQGQTLYAVIINYFLIILIH